MTVTRRRKQIFFPFIFLATRTPSGAFIFLPSSASGGTKRLLHIVPYKPLRKYWNIALREPAWYRRVGRGMRAGRVDRLGWP